MKSNYDRLIIGMILGIIVPLISTWLFYKSRFAHISLMEFIDYLIMMRTLPKLLSLMVIPNLLVFYIFIWLKHLYAARGVLFATFIDAFIVLLIKFLI